MTAHRFLLTLGASTYLAMKEYFVYMLKCADGSYYTGVTNDIDRRLFEHQSGFNKSCYTFKRRPVELVFCHIFNEVYNAIEREKQIKGWTRKKKEALIRDDWDELKNLAVCKNDSHFRVRSS